MSSSRGSHRIGRTCAAGAALSIAGPAAAALVGAVVEVGPEQHPEAGVVTVRVHLVFSSELDQLLAVSDDADIAPHRFQTDGASLRQNCAIAGAACACDAKSGLDLGGDSWVTIGDEEGAIVDGIDDCPPAACCIAGDRFSGGGYFDGNPGTPALPDEAGRVLIAQLSLPDGASFTYEGTASYNLEGGDLVAGAFAIEHRVCRGDLDASGAVDFDDLLLVLTRWGPTDPCPPHRAADLDKDCVVDFDDLLRVLSAWGPCAARQLH